MPDPRAYRAEQVAAKWDGIPDNPDQTGMHYITDAAALWVAHKRKWVLLGKGRDVAPEWLAAQLWAVYRGPVPALPLCDQ